MKIFFLIVLFVLLCLGIYLLPRNKHVPLLEKPTSITSEIQIHKKTGFEKQSSKLQDKLDKIIIKHMEFEDASISTVINLLRAEVKKLDPDNEGINIVLLLNSNFKNKQISWEGEEDDADDFLEDKSNREDEDDDLIDDARNASGERTITIMFDDLSLGEAIRNICIAADLLYRVEEYAVVVFSNDIALDKLETRIYPLSMDAFVEIGENDYEEGSTLSVKDYFIRRGIAFPGKAQIVYDNTISRIIATNTADNLKKIELIIDELNVIDPQVLITSRFIKIPENEYRKIKTNYKQFLSAKWSESLWTKLLRSKSTEIIASATVLTQNGEEAVIRMVREVYFPESWGEGSSAPAKNSDEKDDKNDQEKEIKKARPPNGQILSSTAMPEFGEPTRLGIRMIVTPTVDPDKYTMSIDVIPIVQYFIGWTNHANGVRMPIIKTWTNQSQHTLYDGHTIMLASSLEDVYDKPTKKRQKNRFILLLTARLILPDGTALRDGTKTLAMGRQTIQPVIPESSLNSTEKKLSELVLQNINFTDVNVQTILKYLGEELYNKGENIQVLLGVLEEDMANVPVVTLNLENIPFSEVIRYLCLKAGLNYRIKDNNVLIAEECDPFETRFFKLRSALFTYIAHNSTTSEALMAYFSERGVPFPSDSFIGYDKRAQRLVVRNTPENLRRLGGLLRCLDLEQPQVIVESTIVEISNEKLIKLIGKEAALGDNLTAEQIEKIITSKAGRILASQEIMSKSGEEATIRLVNETYFPESWTEPELASVNGFVCPTDAYPEFGEATDIGARFIVTPTVAPDNHTITLSINPRILKMLGWSKYKPTMTIDTGRSVKTSSSKVAMPKTSLKELNSNIRIYNGTSILAAKTQLLDFPNVKKDSMNANTSWTSFLKKSKKNGNRSKSLFFFIKATIINPDGEGI